eukprot:SAG11_NODE_5043_length_1681_cov_3.587231_2_plen_138_part_00
MAHPPCALQAVGAVARAPVEVICAVPACRQLVAAAMDECLAVARAEGVGVDPGFTEQYLATASGSPAGTTVSTIRDVLGGRQSELPELSGAVAAHGGLAGVPTPTHSFCLAALAAMEARARGELEPYQMKGVELSKL